MDDALALYAGKWSLKSSRSVLILVVMDDALAPVQTQVARRKLRKVLILVVMDDALARQNLGYALFKRIVRLVCAS